MCVKQPTPSSLITFPKKKWQKRKPRGRLLPLVYSEYKQEECVGTKKKNTDRDYRSEAEPGCLNPADWGMVSLWVGQGVGKRPCPGVL